MVRTCIRLTLLPILLLYTTGCGGGADGGRLSAEGESCTRTAQCRAPLVCVNRVCGDGASVVDVVAGDVVGDGAGAEDAAIPDLPLTWVDPETGLEWQVTTIAERLPVAEAVAHCEELNLAGFDDWRLPTIGELRSLIRGCWATQTGGVCTIDDDGCLAWDCRIEACNGCNYMTGPGPDGVFWPPTLAGACCRYWSSTPVDGSEIHGWGIDFSNAVIASPALVQELSVRCVRE